MAIQNVKRWQWIGLSLIVGAAIGMVQRMPRDNWGASYGQGLTQHQFEDALFQQHDGRPCFKDLVVYPAQVQEVRGPGRAVHIVAGSYFGSRPGATRDRTQPQWHARCFVAQTPYHSFGESESAGKAATVLTFLDSLKNNGVSYSYAWWRDPKWAMSFWVAGSVLVVGLIWPTVINILVFGRFFRLREKKAELGHRASVLKLPKAAVSSADLEEVTKMGDELAARLAADACDAAPPAHPAEQPQHVKELTATKLDVAADEQTPQGKEFGRGRDDFYPTERHVRAHEPQ